MRHGLPAALLQRQTGLCPIERLDLAFLIAAQHQGMLGRIQVQTHHAFEFLGKPWILADLEGLYQVRLQGGDAQ